MALGLKGQMSKLGYSNAAWDQTVYECLLVVSGDCILYYISFIESNSQGLNKIVESKQTHANTKNNKYTGKTIMKSDSRREHVRKK